LTSQYLLDADGCFLLIEGLEWIKRPNNISQKAHASYLRAT
jgi:hypothetical protein